MINLPFTTNIGTGCGHNFIEYINDFCAKFERNGGTCIELQCHTLLSYIFSTSAEKKPLLIHEENSVLQKKKIEHYLPVAVSDVTHILMVVQASSIVHVNK